MLNIIAKGHRSRQGSCWRKKSHIHGYDGSVHVQRSNGRAHAEDFCKSSSRNLAKLLGSWNIESEAKDMSREVRQKAITYLKKRKTAMTGITSEILEALSAEQTEALTEKLQERCQHLDGSRKSE